jgi:glucose-1-phosphate adenylyltransferase
MPPAKFVLDEDGRRGEAINSLVAGGCIVSGATLRESLLFSNCQLSERSLLYRSVLLPNVRVGRNCRISRAILDEGCDIPDGTTIGEDPQADSLRFHVTGRGVVLVTPDMLEAMYAGESQAPDAAPPAELRSSG